MELIFWIRMLSIAGFVISLYFFAVYRGWLSGDARWIPKAVCSKNTCHEIITSPLAKIFRIPNFILGMVYYWTLFVVSYFDMPFAAFYIVLVITWFVMFFSWYLAYTLVHELKMQCILCSATHLINTIIAMLFFVMSLTEY